MIPLHRQLHKAYERLLHPRPAPLKNADLALFTQWSRFDPRLAEIWVVYMASKWEQLSPLLLRNCILRQPWPACAGVLLEVVEKVVRSRDTQEKRRLFRLWKLLVTEGFPKAPFEQFFLGLRPLGSQDMFDDARFAIREYRKWGYLGREIPLPKEYLSQPSKSALRPPSLSPETRSEILKSLFEHSHRIRTTSYWDAVGRCISRRQAERDLNGCRWIQSHGDTRGRYFTKRRRN